MVALALSAGPVRSQTQPAVGPESTGETPMWLAYGQEGMVASDSVLASQAGLSILRSGGNAVDAAVATSLMLGVTRPGSTGLGGGGFFLVFMASGEVAALDAREVAPRAATADMFVRARQAQPDHPSPSEFGPLAVGVPGLAAGYAELLRRFGTRDLRMLTQPAFERAVNGFPMDAAYRGALIDAAATLRRHPMLRDNGAGLWRTLLFYGDVPTVGYGVQRHGLARTLWLLGDQGAEMFYRGEIARALVATLARQGGLITLDDLANYRPVWRDPLRVRYRDRYELLLMPPPSSGGVCIAETLRVLEHVDLPTLMRDDPGLAAHWTLEAAKHAFADRARYLGDPDHADVPVDRLLSRDYAAELAGRINPRRTLPVEQYGLPLPDDAGTSHLCVVDRWGNVVSATETINTVLGSLVMVEEYGLVLNNEMDDFTAVAGGANAFGLVQSAKNAVAPGKRPLSSMSPTIVLEQGRPVLAVGAAGGPRIITATLQVLLHVLDGGSSADVAAARPRWHQQWQPNVVYRNDYPADDPVMESLRARGHILSDERRGSTLQAIQFEPGRLIGVSDPRRHGAAAGY